MKHSVQVYSIRNHGSSLDERLALIARLGYPMVESVATHELAPAVFAATLAQHGLKLGSMHASLDQVEHERAVLVEACRLTGCPLVVMPFLHWGHRPRSVAGWHAMGQRLARIHRAFADEGVRFAYHNHDWDFMPYEGRAALAWMFEAAPDLGWEVDVGWLVRSGQDAPGWIEREGHRIAAAHVKELAAEGASTDEDGWTALGAGVMDWARLLPLLRERTDLFVFEHDNPKHPEACLRDSLAFMRQHLA